MIGKRLSHYRILESIGAGGMGVVYRARDERLHRDVALKILRSESPPDENSRKRFRKEALSLSRLNHPRIGVVHDFDTQDGVDFLVMELIPGTTLAERLRGGALPETEAVRIGAQIAEALEAAHEAGVVHWDLKPGNVMVTPRGDVKVLDFGLARRILQREPESLTRTATESAVTGTAPYMAPEQLLGGKADARVDIWALGVVLYEMVTGARPFEADGRAGLADAILHREPRRPRALRRSIPPWLDALILRCLRKDPAARYPSARSLLQDLVQAKSTPPPFSWRSLRAMAVPALVVAALLGGGAALFLRWQDRGAKGGAEGASFSLAVLPLENLSGDPAQEFFADGMTEELTTALAQLGSLRVTSRTSAMQFKGAKMSLPEIARKLGVGAIVQGTVRRSSELVRVSAQLIDAVTDRNLWAASFERPPTDVLRLQNDIASSIAEQVRVRISPEERTRLAAARPVDPEAHEAYLRGRYYASQSYTPENMRRAMREFNRAIAIDPAYARAYAGLAETYVLMSNIALPPAEAMPKARAAAARALEIDSTLAMAQATLANVQSFYDWKWKEGERGFRRALEFNPSEAIAHRDYGYLLLVHGRFGEAEAELKRAAEIDPLSSTLSIYRLIPLYEGRRYDEAIAAASKVLEDDSSATHARFIRAQSYLAKGDRRTAYTEIQSSHRASPQPYYVAYLAYIHAIQGERVQALRILKDLESQQRLGYVQPYGLAVICLGLGDKDGAFRWLERSVEGRAEESLFLRVDPVMDPLRSDPRYRALIRRLGFES